MCNIGKVAIFGTKEAAKIARNWAKINDIEVVCFVDDFTRGSLDGIPILLWREFLTIQDEVDALIAGANQLGLLETRDELHIPFLKIPYIYYKIDHIKELFLSLKNSRYKKGSVELFSNRFRYVDELTFKYMLKEIFIDETYRFKPKNQECIIYDIGANIGVSTLYFAKQYPNAKIKAYEADKDIFEVLKENMSFYKNVEVFNKAAWIRKETLKFNQEGSDCGAICNEGDATVEGIRLFDILRDEKEIDLLKMDIEGAENRVFFDIVDILEIVENLIIEFHYKKIEEENLSEVLSSLQTKGFVYYLETINKRKSPLYEDSNNDFFFQVNIYAKKIS